MCILIKGWIDTIYDDKLQYYKLHNIDAPIIYDIYLFVWMYLCMFIVDWIMRQFLFGICVSIYLRFVFTVDSF